MNKDYIHISNKIDAALYLRWFENIYLKEKPLILKTRFPMVIYSLFKDYVIKNNCIVHCYLYNGLRLDNPGPPFKTSFLYTKKLCKLLGIDYVVIRLENVKPIIPELNLIKNNILDKFKIGQMPRIKINFCKDVTYSKDQKIKFLKTLSNYTKTYPVEVCYKSDVGHNTISCVSFFDCSILGTDLIKKENVDFDNTVCNCLGNKKYIKTYTKSKHKALKYNIF